MVISWYDIRRSYVCFILRLNAFIDHKYSLPSVLCDDVFYLAHLLEFSTLINFVYILFLR